VGGCQPEFIFFDDEFLFSSAFTTSTAVEIVIVSSWHLSEKSSINGRTGNEWVVGLGGLPEPVGGQSFQFFWGGRN
jgi:hypothetical protein